jgi:queuine tRNA-ribosyltransferase
LSDPGFFKLISQSGKARRGQLRLLRGRVETPVFMPVATVGAIKGLTSRDLIEMGVEICLANTYHMFIRPGMATLEHFSGLHRFMNWPKPILTDSGGFQVFSLAKLRQINEEGVRFRSHIDGMMIHFTPEEVVSIQERFGSDIHMVLDECCELPATHERAKEAMQRSMRWAKRCREAKSNQDLAQFGIVQGGTYTDLRIESAKSLQDIGFDGYAIGGLSVGESIPEMREMTELSAEHLPVDKARYLMGVGTPIDLIESVALGVDMFDCVLPARNARRATLYTSQGKVIIKNQIHKNSEDPLDPSCTCYTCTNYSRSFLRHMFLANEATSYRLLTLHNLHYYHNLMASIRTAIEDGSFENLLSHHRDLWAAK